jgi:uncharacterized protein (TIGR03086 family)
MKPQRVCRLPGPIRPQAAVVQAVGTSALLAGAIRYALGAAAGLEPHELAQVTPCADWDVACLLRHLSRSMRDIETVLLGGEPPAGDEADPVELLRDRAAALIWTWFTTTTPAAVRIGGLPLPRRVLAQTAAIEIAVHGWDLYAARGLGREIPADLASTMLASAWPLAVNRKGLFASPMAVPPCASPGDLLIAYLGRDPGARHRRPSASYRRVA